VASAFSTVVCCVIAVSDDECRAKARAAAKVKAEAQGLDATAVSKAEAEAEAKCEVGRTQQGRLPATTATVAL